MKILIVGASGYIGGSLAEHLRDIGHDVTGMVRTDQKAAFLQQRGVAAVVGSLTDTAVLETAARFADVVVNAAEADDAELVRPLIAALAGSGKGLIHTSGSSIVVDDARGAYAGQTIVADDQPFAILANRVQRDGIDRMVRTAGITDGIRAAVICLTLIYGDGRGWKRDSHQVPLLKTKSLELGAGVHLGEGRSIWSNVYLDDLLDLYARAIERAPSGAFFFAENGESTWADTATAISRSLGFEGRTIAWPVDEATAEFGGVAPVALASNCRVRATNARNLLGWTPHGPELAEIVEKS